MATGLEETLGPVLARSAARHAGLVVGVDANRERGLWHRGRLPDGPRSIFEIGSITKVFTTTLLAAMARDGLVALDDPVQRHLPDGVRMPVRGRPITLEDLAAHRSGLPRLPKGMLVRALTRDRTDPYAHLDAARLEAAIVATRPKRAPGERAGYSNYGMGLLGHVLARRAGTTFEDLVRARICEPLGLRDTWIDAPAADRGRVATGHARGGREVPHWHLGELAGAGGLRSSADDLLAFLALHAPPRPGSEDRSHTERFSARSGASRDIAELRAAAAETRRPRARLGALHVGLGWIVVPAGTRLPVRRARHETLVHEGGTGGFRSFAAVVPATGTAVVVLASQARTAGRLGLQLLSRLER